MSHFVFSFSLNADPCIFGCPCQQFHFTLPFLLCLFLDFLHFRQVIKVLFCDLLSNPYQMVRLPALAKHQDAHHPVDVFAPLVPHFLQIHFDSLADYLQIFLDSAASGPADAIFVAPVFSIVVSKQNSQIIFHPFLSQILTLIFKRKLS